MTVPEALARAASRYGARAAYVEGSGGPGRSLTWRELWERSRAVAAGLVELGLNPGDRVAICAENSLEWIVAWHAVAAAGASAVLVYFDLKPDEVRDQVQRPECRFLFAGEAVLSRLGAPIPAEKAILLGAGSGALTLNALAARSDRDVDELLRSRAPEPDDMAAIIYTSGTTAGPKGVMLSHRNLLSGARSGIRALRLTARDSALLVVPLHHSLAFIVAAVMPVLMGGTIFLENNLRRVTNRLQEHRPTAFFGVPGLYEIMYRGILSRAESEGRLGRMQKWQSRVRLIKRLTGVNIGPLVFRPVHRALGGRIRFLVSGAAALKPQTALDFFSLGLPLLQGCGVTEAASAVAVQRFSGWRFLFTRDYEHHAGSVGQALPGVQLRLVDLPERDIYVKSSGEGELQIRGPNVFLGYWQAPEATAAAMDDGWFRTGDLARMDGDGNVYITGRSKFVIVLDSGEKVHPEELEEKLESSDLVGEVCVTARRPAEKPVVAAVIYPNVEPVLARLRDARVEPDAGSVQQLIAGEVERLGETLAAYKRVSRIELTDEPLPKTAVRKVARGRLAASYGFDYAKWRASAAAAVPEIP